MPLSAVHVVLNPKSGGGRSSRRGNELIAALRARGVSATLHHTQAPGHGVELAHMLAAGGADAVIAAGGDGTIHDVVNGILRSGAATALGILPLGTGNDFAKVVAGARTLDSALDVIAAGHSERYDAGHAAWSGGQEFFINAMGIGIDVEVVRQILKLPALPAPVKYLLGLMRALAVYRPVALSATIGAERIDRRIMMMAVGNGVCQGGGFYLTPHASPRDGRLDLCVIKALPLWQVPPVLARVLRGTHAGHPTVIMQAVERVRFEAHGSAPLYFQLDGELREADGASRLEIGVRRRALNVLAGLESKPK
ncbi:MAG: diacylglycerol/lipid kinase family protein [Gemmatimonadota bacterium]